MPPPGFWIAAAAACFAPPPRLKAPPRPRPPPRPPPRPRPRPEVLIICTGKGGERVERACAAAQVANTGGPHRGLPHPWGGRVRGVHWEGAGSAAHRRVTCRAYPSPHLRMLRFSLRAAWPELSRGARARRRVGAHLVVRKGVGVGDRCHVASRLARTVAATWTEPRHEATSMAKGGAGKGKRRDQVDSRHRPFRSTTNLELYQISWIQEIIKLVNFHQ